MNRDLGVWTSDDCALVLIDYQPELFESIRSETDAEMVELHVPLLARAAKRLIAAGAVPNTAIALVCELFRDWATPLGERGRELVNWYVNKVSRVPAKVGFALREQLRAHGQIAREVVAA